MKKLMLFYLENCPYCIRALQYMDELKKETPAYNDIPLTMVEERQQRQLANSYDYYYVPCYYIEGEKVSEGSVTKENVKDIFDACLE